MANFNHYFFDEHLLNHPEQAAIIKLSMPRFLVRFNYDEKFFVDIDHFKQEVNEMSWLDGDAVHPNEQTTILQECFDFLTAHRQAVLSLPNHE